jgi:hypothetical protein
MIVIGVFEFKMALLISNEKSADFRPRFEEQANQSRPDYL